MPFRIGPGSAYVREVGMQEVSSGQVLASCWALAVMTLELWKHFVKKRCQLISWVLLPVLLAQLVC